MTTDQHDHAEDIVARRKAADAEDHQRGPPIDPRRAGELARIGMEAFGEGDGWVTRLAQALEINDRAIRRMLAGTMGIRDSILEEARALVQPAKSVPEWIVGGDIGAGGRWLVHTAEPVIFVQVLASGALEPRAMFVPGRQPTDDELARLLDDGAAFLDRRARDRA